jgi:fused signal recognition particle receptor
MFKFLKRKIKKFEDQLEEELEQSIKEDIDEFPESIPVEKPSQTPIQEQEPKIQQPETKQETEHQESLREQRRRKRQQAKLKREQELDQQIEKSIQSELQHTLQTRKTIETQIKKEGKKSVISDEKLEEFLWDLEMGLLESDVAFSVIESLKNDIKEEFRQASFSKGKINEIIEKVLKHAISHVLQSNSFDFDTFIQEKEKPITIMFVGVNGGGKTTAIAKTAFSLKNKGISTVLAAGDTFRAGAIEQLSIHADNIGVKIIKHGPGADPAAVAYDAIEHAKAKHKDVVLLDTAGRMQTNVNLMDEMEKIKRVAKPDLILFVGDALAGNDAVEQAKRFNEIVGIDGVILTKVDTDAKGGSALSVAYTIGKPLLFIGVGQEYKDQIPFDPEWMIKQIFSS